MRLFLSELQGALGAIVLVFWYLIAIPALVIAVLVAPVMILGYPGVLVTLVIFFIAVEFNK